MPLLIGRNPEPKRRSRPRVLGAFIGAKGRALTDAGAEGSSPLSRMLTHPLPSDVILYFPDLIEQLIELLFGHRACGRKKRSHRIHQEQPSSDDLTQLDAGFDAFFVPANLAQNQFPNQLGWSLFSLLDKGHELLQLCIVQLGSNMIQTEFLTLRHPFNEVFLVE